MDEPPLTEENRTALNSLRERLASLPDSRQQGSVKHHLADVLGCALCSVICGYDDFCAMEMFTKHRLKWLREFLPLENGAPSHDTFRNVLTALNPAAFSEVIGQWCGELAGRHVAVDGKASRGTYNGETGKCALHLLRAWVDDLSLSAGRVACEEKRNEIEAIPRLLALLDLRGATVTIDAMGCQRDIAERIDDAGAAYILALKANQKQTHDTVREHFGGVGRPADAASEEQSHGRYEKRECWVESNLDFFDKSWKWQGLTSVVHIRRETCRPGTRGADGREAVVEDHYYLCSAPPEAEAILATVRAHWSVENRCHWTLDVVFGDDACQVRGANAAQNLGTLRDIALHMLRSHPRKLSLAKKRQEAALDSNFRAEVIANFHA